MRCYGFLKRQSSNLLTKDTIYRGFIFPPINSIYDSDCCIEKRKAMAYLSQGIYCFRILYLLLILKIYSNATKRLQNSGKNEQNAGLRKILLQLPFLSMIPQSFISGCLQYLFMKNQSKVLSLLKIAMIFLIFETSFALRCREGVTILTRIQNNNTYQLKYQCLCPIDYFGPGCRQHRTIKCYLTKKSMSPSQLNQSNFAESVKMELEVNAQCYIEQKPGSWKILEGKQKEVTSYMPLMAFLMKRRDMQSNLDYELESGEKGGEIIWANNSNLFYDNGRLKYVQGYQFTLDEEKRKIMTLEDQAKILQKYQPLKFDYKATFLGFPMTNSKFYVIPKVIRPTRNIIHFERQQLHFVNYQEYTKLVNQTKSPQISQVQQFFKDFTIEDLLNENLLEKVREKLKETQKTIQDISQNKLLPYFKIPLTIEPRTAAEFKNIRIQVSLLQYYFQDLEVQALSVNGIQFILPTNVPGLGEAKVYSVNFNKKQISRIVYFLFLVCLVGVGFLIYTLRKRKHNKKLKQIKRNVEEMQEVIPWK